MMPLEVRPGVSESDIAELSQCCMDAFNAGKDQAYRIFFPEVGSDPASRAQEYKLAANGLTAMSKYTFPCKWFKVVNTDTGAIVGLSVWQIHQQNPYENAKPRIAEWYPEGAQRDFFSKMLQATRVPMRKYMSRPHIYLQLVFVHPDWWAKGAGDLALEAGTIVADELGLDCWVNGSPLGKKLYARWGFVTIEEFNVVPNVASLNEEEKKLALRIGEAPVTFMWRPVGGVYEEGKTRKSWET